MANDKPTFSRIESGSSRLFVVKIPDTLEGMDMLAEVGRMFSHRGEYDTAKRIERIVVERRQALRPSACDTESGQASEQDVRARVKAAQTCTVSGCGQDRASFNHHTPYTRGRHKFKP